MSQITNSLTAICFNLNCHHPHNPFTASFCLSCQATLQLQERYLAVKILGQGHTGRVLLALDWQQNPTRLCVIQQSRIARQGMAFSQIPGWSMLICLDSPTLRPLSYHPQIPTIWETFDQDGTYFLVQEYIPGPNLAMVHDRASSIQKSQTGNAGSTVEVWTILQGVLPILNHIQTLGVVHGDIKPENLIVRGAVLNATALVLVDWGAAKVIAPDGFISGVLAHPPLGNAEYAAPEQLAGYPGFASDLYSLGVICVQLLTGIRPLMLLDSTRQTWVWRDYWLPNPDRDDLTRAQLELADFLDQMIALDLSQRFASAQAAIASFPKLWKPAPRPPSMSVPWHCVTEFSGHKGLFASVNAVAISPQGDVIASASDDQTIRVWNANTGQERLRLTGHQSPVKAVLFHPHQPQVLISGGSDCNIRIWDLATGSCDRILQGHLKSVNALALSADGNWLVSGSTDKTIRIWEFSTGNCRVIPSAHSLAVNAVAFTPAWTSLVSAGADARVQVWNPVDLEQIQTLEAHTNSVIAIAISPSGDCCATAGQDRVIHLWDARTWQLQQTLPGHTWVITGLVFSPDGAYLFSSSWDHTIKGWNLKTGKVISVLAGHRDSVTGLAWATSADILASSSRDQTLRLWKRSPFPRPV